MLLSQQIRQADCGHNLTKTQITEWCDLAGRMEQTIQSALILLWQQDRRPEFIPVMHILEASLPREELNQLKDVVRAASLDVGIRP